MTALVSWSCLAVVAAGCASDDPASRPESLFGSVDSVALGLVADLPEASIRVAGEPSLRIGGGDGDVSELLDRVSAATLRSDGSVVVAEARIGSVRLFDASGRLVRVLGMQGDGPGEFRSPADVLATPDDSVLVWDPAHWRLGVFAPGGDFVRSERVDPTVGTAVAEGRLWPARLRLGGGGRHLVRLEGWSKTKAGVLDDGGAAGVVAFGLLRLSSDGPEVVAIVPDSSRVEVAAPWGPTEVALPLGGGPVAVVSRRSGRICVGHSAFAELLCADPGRDPTRVTWAGSSEPLTPDDPDLAAWRDATRSAFGAKMTGREVDAFLAAIPVPDRGPAYRGAHLDAIDHLWIDLGPARDGGSREYLVLDPDLQPVGTTRLPGVSVLEVGADYLLGVREDDLGRQELVRLELERRGGMR